jgi:RsiW-degrading membrane proteinase PrsW (M82 family)
MGLLLSLILGFAPMLLFAWMIYWLDRYEKEPKLLLGGVFMWGALVAAGAAFLINTLMGVGVYLATNSESITTLVTGSLVAPMVEETLKGVAVLVVFLLIRQEFDSLMDGIVYAGIVALGFAASENAYYLYEYGYKEGGYTALMWIFFVRVFLVGWQHPFYTAFIGIGLAVARLGRSSLTILLAPLLGFSLAVTLHAVHNTIGSVLPGGAGLALGSIYDWSGWTFLFLFILWAIARERSWIVEHLREEVRLGLISPAHYRTACSAWQQSQARIGALTKGSFLDTSRFYQLCGELAHKKQQLLLKGEESGNSQIIESLRTQLASLSQRARV